MAINNLQGTRQLMRFSGLASGMDTESIVDNMMRIEQMKVDKQWKSKTKTEWRIDALKQINTDLRNFRAQNMSVLNPETNMMSAAAYNKFEVHMLTETNYVSVSANDRAVAGDYAIDVKNLATSAKVESSNLFHPDQKVSLDTKLSEIAEHLGLEFEEDPSEPAPVDADGNPLLDEDGNPVAKKKYISFEINGEAFKFTEDTSISSMISTVNRNAKAGVTMSYSQLTQGFSITSKSTGADKGFTIENKLGNAFGAESAFGITETEKKGTNAQVVINGVEVERSTNNFTIDGISYALRAETTEVVKFNVARDVDGTLGMIKDFIGNFNEMVENLNGKLKEKTYRAYDPLTDEERDMLTEKQADEWENFAKSGMLRNNSQLSGFLNELRSSFYTPVEGIGKSLADIGLTTGYYGDGAKITIDEARLKSALEDNPEEVYQMFASVSESKVSSTKFKENGLITRISDAMNKYVASSSEISISSAEMELKRAEDRLQNMTERMTKYEDSLWARFTAMETAISQMNSQSNWLASQLGSIG